MDLVCEACSSSAGIDLESYENFGVSICYSCKESNILYGIITKTQARNDYLLTDEELADSTLLPSISRKNPHNPRWADMKLYLRRQVRDFAVNKHGSEESIKEALVNRNENRTDRKSKQFLKKLKGTDALFFVLIIHIVFLELRSKTKVEKRINLTEKVLHIHFYVSGVCTICGLKVVQEEI